MIKKQSTEKPSKLQRQMTDLEKSGTIIKKKTTEELWGREEYFRALIENSLDIIIVVNKKGTVTYVSPSVERFLGYKPGELIGKSAFKFIIPTDLPRAIYDFGKAILTKEVVIPNSFRIRRKDSSECILEGVGKNLLNNPSVRGFVMNVRDVTRRKQAEEELRKAYDELEIRVSERTAELVTMTEQLKEEITERKRSEQRFRSLAENTSDWIWEVDQSLVFTYTSPKVKDLLGYEPNEVIGKTPFDFMPEHEARRISEISHSILASRKPFKSLEHINLRKDGQQVILETSSVPIFDKNSNFSGYRGIDRDITERKKTEEILKEHERELEINARNLEEVNTALKVLLKKRDEDRIELEEKVLLNIKELVLPYLEKIKKGGLDKSQSVYADILESHLKEIVSSFSYRLSSVYLNLTPAEINVANLVKQGKTNKEIAKLLNISTRTSAFHRERIRKKLGIKNKKTNLKAYLSSIN